MKLSHLVVVVFVTTINLILLMWLLVRVGVPLSQATLQWLSMPVAVFAALLLAWPISRLLGLSPLMIFAGPCPGCRTRPPGWWVTRLAPRRLLLMCRACGKDVELWLRREAPTDRTSESRHMFTLRWPEFLGIWRQVR